PFTRFQALTGVADAAAAKRVQDGLAVLRMIAVGPERTSVGKGAISKIEEIAINLASRNAGFVSRMLAGRLGPGFFERVLFTPEGLRSLETLGNKAATRSAIAVAGERLTQIMLNLDAEKEEAM